MNSKYKLSVQSFCFEKFLDNAVVIEKVKACGLDQIEICGLHADFNAPDTFDSVIDSYRDAGIKIVSIGVEVFGDDEAAARKRFEFAKKAGCKVISTAFDLDTVPACLELADKLTEEYGINLAIHPHGPKDWLGCAETVRWVFKQTSPRVGLMIDTAWTLASQEDPVDLAEEFKDRLYGLHLKDFVFESNGAPKDVVIGTGTLRLKALMETLEKNNFDGPLILEYEADVPDPVDDLIECVKSVTAAM